MTPSHNPPESGGFKYNPPNGGPADGSVTGWIEKAANALLETGLDGLLRMPLARALAASTTHRHDYLNAYVDDLANVIDMDVIRGAPIRLGVDPLGGAGVHYWAPIAERYGLNLTILNDEVDPTFRFMSLDWDGRIRMDPSSPYAMQPLLGQKDHFDVAFLPAIPITTAMASSRVGQVCCRPITTSPCWSIICSRIGRTGRLARRWAKPSSAAR